MNRINKFLVIHGLLGRRGRKFKSGNFYYYNGLRATFKKALPYTEKPGRALDIGAGFGNETRELLKRGFEVVATDVNPDAVKYLKKLSKKERRLTPLATGLPDTPEGKFDFVACEMVLHFLEEKDVLTSIKKMQQATKIGGLNIVSSYINSHSIHEDSRFDGYFKYLMPSGKLEQLYNNWEILYQEEKKNAMGHSSIRFIARKVNKT